MKIKTLLFTFLLPFSTFVLAQQSNEVRIATAVPQESNGLQQRRAELEVEKLEVEIAKLKEPRADLPTWLTALLGLLAGAATAAATLVGVQRARKGAMDQATHEKRLEFYPKLVKATSPLAIYFPVYDNSGKAVSREQCEVIGRKMSDWYFGAGGLLMSEKTRDAYFKLARALTRASSAANKLDVPEFPADAEGISKEKLDHYRRQLGKELSLPNAVDWMQQYDVDKWTFGGSSSKTQGANRKPHLEFKDYVFLQNLSSLLRSELSTDLHSRRRLS